MQTAGLFFIEIINEYQRDNDNYRPKPTMPLFLCFLFITHGFNP